MKEYGILMSQAMIQAYIAGRKTMTRRTSKRWKKAQAGDRLWFRETWQWFGNGSYEDIMANVEDFWYRASCDENADAVKWRPSIFMPRRAARFTPPILEIRNERLQDITEEDAIAEGVHWYGYDDPEQTDFKNYLHSNQYDDFGVTTAIDSFATLWDSINGDKEGESWDDNPEVYVITFPRHEQ